MSPAVLIVASLTAGAALLLGGVAHADDPSTRCTVRVVKAFEHGQGSVGAETAAPSPDVHVDPKIDKLRPYFSHPPFTAWHEFVLIDERTLDLKLNAPQRFSLPNGKPVSLTFVEHLPDQPGHPHRVRVQLQLGDPAHPSLNTVFAVDEGAVVLQAGQRHKKCLLIVGTSCEHPR